MQTKEIKLTRKQEAIASGDKKFLVPTFVTTDYDKFMLIDSNRLIKPGKSSKLKEDIDDIGMVNSVQDKWTLHDSLHHYCSRGIHDYKVLSGFRKKYQYPISTLIHILSGRNDKTMLDEFRRGEFRVTQRLDLVHDLLSKIQQFRDFNDKIYRHRTFLKVYMDLMTHPEFEHEKMIHKVEQVPMKFVYCTRIFDYLRMIEEVYNYNNRNPIKLY